MGLKAPNFSGFGAKTITVGTIESQDATSVQVDLGDDAGDDFIVDTNKLVVEGDSGRVGIGTASPAKTLSVDGDMHFQPTATSTAHLTTAGSLKIQATNNIRIGDDGADSIRLGRTNSTACKVHLRSGTDTDMVLFNSQLGLGTETPGTQLQLESTAPYITLKNDTAENTANGCESKIIFEDHGNNALGQIEVSHVGSSDDEKGQLIISTNNDSGLQTALTISEAQKVTAAGDVQVAGDIIIDDGGSLKEAGGTAAFTFDGSGHVTKIGQDSPSSGQFLKWDGSKAVWDAVATGSSAADDISTGDAAVTIATSSGNITLDAQAGDADIIFKGTDNTSDITALTLDMSEAGAALFNAAVTVGTDLIVTGGDVSYGNGQDATLSVAETGSGTDGRDLTISAGSAPTGSANQNGGDLLLKAGGGDGTGTSVMTFSTKVNGTDAAAERMRLHTNGYLGIGTNAPSTLVHAAASEPILVIQNTDNEHGADEAESKIIFADHAGNALATVEGAHSGSSDDSKGKFKISTDNGSGTQLAMSIDDAQITTFAANVVVGGTTPKITIGDAGAEDTMLAFDGNAVDYRIGIDDGTDTLEIGVGTAHGTTPALTVDSSQNIDVFKAINLDSAIADNSVCGITAVFTAGEALNRGDVVYFKAADSKMHKVNMTAGNSEAIPAVAMAADDISADAVGKFLLQGFIHDAGTFPSYTIAGRLYAPEAEGPPTQTAPSTDGDLVQVIGWAVTADKIYFSPSPDYIEVS